MLRYSVLFFTCCCSLAIQTSGQSPWQYIQSQMLKDSLAEPIPLNDFISSDLSRTVSQSMFDAEPGAKAQLMQLIYQVSETTAEWPIRRNYIASIIRTGCCVDTYLDKQQRWTFLGKAIWENDIPAVAFGLICGADTHVLVDQEPLLCIVKSQALLDMLAPYLPAAKEVSRDTQWNIIKSSLWHDHEPAVLKWLFDSEYDFTLRDPQGNTLLHTLCGWAYTYANQDTLREKFMMLIQRGIDIQARNHAGHTAYDIAQRALHMHKLPTTGHLNNVFSEHR